MVRAEEIQAAGGCAKWHEAETRRASQDALDRARLRSDSVLAAAHGGGGQAQPRADFAPLAMPLPWPPSVNHYWRRDPRTGRVLVSAKGREYRGQVQSRRVASFGSDRLAVVIVAHPPDRRKRDLDNLPKAVLDALTHAGVWDDDSQIDDLRIMRGQVVKGGGLVVTIRRIPR